MIDNNYNPSDLSNTTLFKPIKLSDAITLQHRVVLPPMTRARNVQEHCMSQDTSYLEEQTWKDYVAIFENKTGEKQKGLTEEYYHQRSQRKGTLVIVEATIVSLLGGGHNLLPGIYNKPQVKSLSKIVRSVHDNESFIFVQIATLGRKADASVLQIDGCPYLSASATYMDKHDERHTKQKSLACGNLLRACTIDDIEQLKKDYINAAKNAFEAGADGIEIHSSNGFLLHQFLDKKVNKRKDKYGCQSFENRCRFLLEVFDELVKNFSAENIALRVSPFAVVGDMTGFEDNKDTISLYTYLFEQLELRRLKKQGPVYISIIEPREDEKIAQLIPENLRNVTIDFIFDTFNGVVIRAGNIISDGDFVKKIATQNNRTLIAVGRYFVSNPDLVFRLENQLPLNMYDRTTFYSQTYQGFVDYPYYKED